MSSPESAEEGGQYVGKWNILFGRAQSHWTLVDPEEGVHVYPCYACRDLFASVTSFVDHINRISIGLKYFCSDCCSTYNFYNPCALLLHARQHFHTSGGVINLGNMLIYHLPLGLIGFPPHPDVPLMFDIKEEEIATGNINSCFYNPMGTQKGLKFVKLAATYLLFFNTKEDGNRITMMLKQVCSNIPKCVFVVTQMGVNHSRDNGVSLKVMQVQYIPSSSNNTNAGNNCTNIDVGPQDISNAEDNAVDNSTKQDCESGLALEKPVDTSSISIGEIEHAFKCTECNMLLGESGSAHFQQANVPTDPVLQCEICNFVSPGVCSSKAHTRIHDVRPPFVCPECGVTFEKFLDLLEHQNRACYHFSKQVRLKCSKKHCSKIFAYHVNYKQHFSTHVSPILKCPKCTVYYLTEDDLNSHTKHEHPDENLIPDTSYHCTACDDRILSENEYGEHIEWHCDPNKTNNQVYVYICRYCKNYFRTPTTYATHIERCNRKDVSLAELISMRFAPTMTYCTNCDFIILFKVSLESCPKCGLSENLFHHQCESTNEKKLKCSLCSHRVLPKVRHKCKFEKPVVVLNSLGDIADTVLISDHTYDLNSQIKSTPIKTIEKRKRKSTSPHNQYSRKKPVRSSLDGNEVSLETPKPFDGTYSCKLCDFSTAERMGFHDHLLAHRDGTVYQCMECGESFVVRPSFEKHLIYFHQITDVDRYISENDCCGKDIEGQSQGGPDNEPLLEKNQCKVCGRKFDDGFELQKHFRVHGMAFLLNKTRLGS